MVVFVGRIRDPLPRFVGRELVISVANGVNRSEVAGVGALVASPINGYGAGSVDWSVESVGRGHVPFMLVLVCVSGFPIC